MLLADCSTGWVLAPLRPSGYWTWLRDMGITGVQQIPDGPDGLLVRA